jgi:hypothetical protein
LEELIEDEHSDDLLRRNIDFFAKKAAAVDPKTSLHVFPELEAVRKEIETELPSGLDAKDFWARFLETTMRTELPTIASLRDTKIKDTDARLQQLFWTKVRPSALIAICNLGLKPDVQKTMGRCWDAEYDLKSLVMTKKDATPPRKGGYITFKFGGTDFSYTTSPLCVKTLLMQPRVVTVTDKTTGVTSTKSQSGYIQLSNEIPDLVADRNPFLQSLNNLAALRFNQLIFRIVEKAYLDNSLPAGVREEFVAKAQQMNLFASLFGTADPSMQQQAELFAMGYQLPFHRPAKNNASGKASAILEINRFQNRGFFGDDAPERHQRFYDELVRQISAERENGILITVDNPDPLISKLAAQRECELIARSPFVPMKAVYIVDGKVERAEAVDVIAHGDLCNVTGVRVKLNFGTSNACLCSIRAMDSDQATLAMRLGIRQTSAPIYELTHTYGVEEE